MTFQTQKILAIIPCFNEADAIEKLLAEFKTLPFICDTLVIDDGSSDQTYERALPLSEVIRFAENKGTVAAILAGIRYAKSNDYAICVQIDGDGQHVPAQIVRLLEAQGRTPHNVTVGSRYFPGSVTATLTPRRLAGLLISGIIYLAFGRWMYDSTSGMRMLDKAAIDYFAEHLEIARPDATIVSQALQAGLSVQEVSVSMRPRISGDSYVSGWCGVYFLGRVLLHIICIRFSRRKAAA